jgi:hypothetical protein
MGQINFIRDLIDERLSLETLSLIKKIRILEDQF